MLWLMRSSLALVVLGCASTPVPTDAPTATFPTMTIVDGEGVVVHRGPGAFYARPGSTAGHTEWVINLPSTGEILIDVEQQRCRLVTSVVVTDVRVWQSTGCAIEMRDAGTRLCLSQQRLSGPASSVVVDGCVDRNELRLQGIEERGALGVGPRAQTERCAELPAEGYNYLRLQLLEVEGNAEPRLGARFRHDGDGFSLCFLTPLQRAHGVWRAEVWAESPTAGPTVLRLGGDVLDL
jgi:hypothetical protein